jgi:hypothetical protein
MQAPRNDAVLGPDFAHRVVARVRQAKRRRQLYRWTVTAAALCALGTLMLVSLPARNLSQERSTVLASRGASHAPRFASPGELATPAEDDLMSFGQPLAFFFPASGAVAEFQSSEATYWHSYDPWWNPAGAWASPAVIRSPLE